MFLVWYLNGISNDKVRGLYSQLILNSYIIVQSVYNFSITYVRRF